MTAILSLAYAEYESGSSPFAWLDGRYLGVDERYRIYERISFFRKRGTRKRSQYGLAVRRQNQLLIQTNFAFRHQDGTRQGVVLVIFGLDPRSSDTPRIAQQAAEVLGEGSITTNIEKLRSVLDWGLAATRGRFLRRIFTRAFARILRHAKYRPVREERHVRARQTG